MVEQIFGALFVTTILAPAAAVVAGIALLAWPARTKTHDVGAHGVSAHA
jgi:hypothetical protein